MLRVPYIQGRTKQFLSGDQFKDEFAHTILHNQDVFAEFKKQQGNLKQIEA